MNNEEHRLLDDIREIIAQARSLTRTHVNALLVISNYLIGMRIVEEEQDGHKRAGYGQETLKQLSEQLTTEFGKGYSHRNLELMRRFYLTYQEALAISQTLSAKSQTYLPDQEALKMQLEEAQQEWELTQLDDADGTAKGDSV